MGWYSRIKSGEVTRCPVDRCGVSLIHDDDFKWYECEDCGWTDELQELSEMGWMEPGQGWPLHKRQCVICKSESNGTLLPSIELAHCAAHKDGHYRCTLTKAETYKDACGYGRTTNARWDECPIQVT